MDSGIIYDALLGTGCVLFAMNAGRYLRSKSLREGNSRRRPESTRNPGYFFMQLILL